MPSLRKVMLGAASAALLLGTAACSSDSGDTDDGAQDGQGAQDSGGGDDTSVRAAFEALSAAAESTQEVTSADFEGVTRYPEAAGGTLEMTGSMSWESELEMDITMTGDQLSADPSMPSEMSVVWVDETMYMDMGEEFAAEFQGRNWMSMNLVDIAEETGDEAVADAMSYGLSEANQDPAQQIGLLLQSPDIEHVGEETLDGATVNHYRGTISTEDALAADESDFLTEEQRQGIVDAMSAQGIDSYDIEVWVDENDFPVQIHQSYDTNQGPVESEMSYHNLGTEVDVTAPPADSVVDFMEIMEELEQSGM